LGNEAERVEAETEARGKWGEDVGDAIGAVAEVSKEVGSTWRCPVQKGGGRTPLVQLGRILSVVLVECFRPSELEDSEVRGFLVQAHSLRSVTI
jgi:hypothetical protein